MLKIVIFSFSLLIISKLINMASTFTIIQEKYIPFTLEFTTTTENEAITLPCSGNVNITVDWGDGSGNKNIGYNNPSYNYSSPGIYIVKIYGNFERMYRCSHNVTKVISWGNSNTSLRSMNQSFDNCSELISIPDDEYGIFSNITVFYHTFRYCSNLTGSIPNNLFANCPNVTSFDSTFMGCRGLTGEIPENLFVKCPNVTDFGSIFRYCSGLTGSIPNNLFANCQNVTSFYNTFNDCSGLTGSIPNNLFANCPNVTSFDSTFMNCRGLTGEIPENLFDNCHNVTSFYGTFYSCSGLTRLIPENLFDSNKKVTNFNYTFSDCSGLTGNTPTGTDGLELWERAGQPGYPSSITGDGCFRSCSKLSNYGYIPSRWK